MLHPSAYRRDIDGLRGLSVLLVVLFHATGSVRGGFIGVDVFFVISGFLITGILLREMQAGQFRFASFWERRIRRILPASLVMALLTLALGCLLLLPQDLTALAQSLRAHVFMVSNLYFWQDSGYFATVSEQKPLLHTWSLAVEEQFYLVFPLLCWALMIWRARYSPSTDLRATFFKVFSVLMLISFAASVIMVQRDASMAFYWLPSRAWELLLGGMLASLPPAWRKAPAAWTQALAAVAFIVILVFALQLRNSMPFPGWLALPPCLAATLLIWAHGPDQAPSGRFSVRRLLESKLFVGLGLISYSLYLWHWPFLAYWEYLDVSFSRSTSHAVKAGLVLLSLVFAYASWRWIETPFRTRQIAATRRPLFAMAVAMLALLFGLGSLMISMEGWPARWSERALRYAAAANQMGIDEQGKSNDLASTLAGKPPRFGSEDPKAPVQVLVWGDSHAFCISPALAELCREKGVAGYLTTYSATPPLLGFTQKSSYGLSEKAEIWGRAILDLVKKQQIPHLLLVGYWSKVAQGRESAFSTALLDTIKQCRATGTRVWLMKDVPIHRLMVPRALALHTTFPTLFPNPAQVATTEAEHRRTNAVIEALVPQLREAGAELIEPTPRMIDDQGRCVVVDGDECLYADVGHHLSIAGALRLKSLFEPLFSTPSP